MKIMSHFRDLSFMTDLWGNLILSIIVFSFIFLIGMYFVQIFIL
jgi:hypothetical protein